MDKASHAILRIRAFSANAETLSEKETLDELSGIATDIAALGQDESAEQLRLMVDSMQKRYRMDPWQT